MKRALMAAILAGVALAGCGKTPEPSTPKKQSRYSKSSQCKKNRRYQDNLH